jgi:hypothetical protein
MTMTTDIDSLVNAAVEKALGGSADKPASTSTPSKPAPAESSIDRLTKLVELDMTARIAERYQSQGGASGAPVVASGYNPEDPATLNRASAEEVAALVRDGKMLQAADAYRNSLPGGTGSIFKKHLR